MKDFRTLIDLWPSVSAFADDIGIRERHAQVMRFRNSVPPDYWSAMVAAAKRRAIKGITYEGLAKLRGGRRPLGRARKPEPRAAA